MRILSIAALGALAVGTLLSGTRPALAQSEVREMPEASPDQLQPELTPAPTTGIIEVIFTITLKTAFPAGSSVACFVSLDADSLNSGTGALIGLHEGNVEFLKTTGTTATCTVSIPYSWPLPASSATVTTLLAGSYQAVVATSTGTLERSSRGDLTGLSKIPATGTTTKISVPITL